MYLPVAQVERVVDDVLKAVAPPGLFVGWRVEETVDWEGSPSLTLHADIDPIRRGEYTTALWFQIMQETIFGLGDLGDDRFVHIQPHDAQRHAAE